MNGYLSTLRNILIVRVLANQVAHPKIMARYHPPFTLDEVIAGVHIHATESKLVGAKTHIIIIESLIVYSYLVHKWKLHL